MAAPESSPNVLYDVNDIARLLPHRYPFLLVDRIVALEPGKSVRAIKNVTVNEPFFQGHFPDKPVMPGVLIIEAMAQAAGVLAFKSVPPATDGAQRIVYLAGVDDARFKRMVVPGDQLVLEAEIDRIVRNVGKFRCRALVDGQLAAEAMLMAALQGA